MGETGIREDEDGLDTGQFAVDLGDVALEFQILNIADTADDVFSFFALGEVNGKVVVADNANALFVLVEALDGSHTFGGADSTLLVDIEAHSDDNLVKEGEHSLNDVGMADGERVKRPRENCCSHI